MRISSVNNINNKYIYTSLGNAKVEKNIMQTVPKYKAYSFEHVKANFTPISFGKNKIANSEMEEFVKKLNPNILAQIESSDKDGTFMNKLLTKSDEFSWLYPPYLEDMADFLSLLDKVKVEDKSLLSQLDDFFFIADENFDISEWAIFIELFDDKKQGEDKTFLERFLNKNTFSELFYSDEFSPSDIIQIINEYQPSPKIWNSTKTREILDLLCDVENSKYDAIERTNTLHYFINLKDNANQKVLKPQNRRDSLISTYKYFMNIDPSSVAASNAQMLLELVSNGVVDNHIFEFLPKDGNLSPQVIDDIDKLYEAYTTGKKPIDIFIPRYKSEKEAKEHLKVGDTYENKWNKKLYLLEKEGSFTELKINKKAYFELFPPIERFATTQNLIGNCWEISPFQAMYNNPNTRSKLLQLFMQEGNNIIVKFPNGKCDRIVFFNGGLSLNDEDSEMYSKGAKGFRLLECADGKELQKEKIKLHRELLEKCILIEPSETNRQKKIDFENMISKFGSSHVKLDFDYDTGDSTFEYSELPVEYTLRDGGYALYLLDRLGFKNRSEMYVLDENTKVFMKDPKNFDESVIIWSTKHDEDICEKYGVADGHAYFVDGYNLDKNGEIETYNVVNPWGMTQVKMTYEELQRTGSAFIIGKLK